MNFIQDVNPVLSKVGCNAGTCHGSQKGRAGFKLSLRGYDPVFDYQALIDDLSGRRFNRSRPEQSLMLLKPTQRPWPWPGMTVMLRRLSVPRPRQ